MPKNCKLRGKFNYSEFNPGIITKHEWKPESRITVPCAVIKCLESMHQHTVTADSSNSHPESTPE